MTITRKRQNEIPYHNYDTGFKEVFGVFRHRTLDFLKIDLPAIQEKTETNLPKIQVRQNTLDLIFRLEDGSLLHLEEEAGVSLEDLLRFAQTDLMLYHEKRQIIHTVILSIHEKESCQKRLSMGSLEYHATQVGLKGMDGDSRMARMEEDFREGRQVNEIELVFIPLMHTKGSRIDLLERVINLVKQLDKTDTEKAHMIACALVLMGKELKKADYDRFKKEVSMVNILRYAEELAKEEGMELGLEKGMERGLERGLEKGVVTTLSSTLIKLLTKRFGLLPQELKDLIRKTDVDSLEIAVDGILDYQSLEDVKRLLG